MTSFMKGAMEKEEKKERLGRCGGGRGEGNQKQRNLQVSCRQDPNLIHLWISTYQHPAYHIGSTYSMSGLLHDMKKDGKEKTYRRKEEWREEKRKEKEVERKGQEGQDRTVPGSMQKHWITHTFWIHNDWLGFQSWNSLSPWARLLILLTLLSSSVRLL